MKPVDLLTGINPLLADRIRLAIMATLASSELPVEFKTLLESLSLTKGNLSSHIRKLEEGNLVSVHKEFVGRKPRTTYTCTDVGREELLTYLKKMESLLNATRLK